MLISRFYLCLLKLGYFATCNFQTFCIQTAIEFVFALANRLRINKAVSFTELKLMRSICLQDTKNGRTFMVTKMLALLENLAINKQSAQSF